MLPRTLVILPTYNERENISRIVPDILAQSPAIDVLVVDDNSPDGTGQLASALAATNPRVSVLHRASKQGLGSAYITGFKWALERGYERVMEMDADYSHAPADVPRLIESTSDNELVIGSRWIPGGGIRNWSHLRQLISRGGSLYARLLLGVPIHDLTSGFKCFRADALASLNLDAVRSNGYAFQVEMNYSCFRSGFRIREVPIVFVDRTQGASKMSLGIVLEAMLVVWKLRLRAAIISWGPSSARVP